MSRSIKFLKPSSSLLLKPNGSFLNKILLNEYSRRACFYNAINKKKFLLPINYLGNDQFLKCNFDIFFPFYCLIPFIYFYLTKLFSYSYNRSKQFSLD